MLSFDAPRERPAPRSYMTLDRDGQIITKTFSRRTLIIAVKGDCDGCRTLLVAGPDAYGPVDVYYVAAENSDDPAWQDQPIILAPDLMKALDIKWPPFWVLIDGEAGLVLCEGVPFGPASIAGSIADLL